MNPDYFTVSQFKEMGIWPPGEANFVKGIYPYIKRLNSENIKILDVGCLKGEISVYMIEVDIANKIEKIDLIVSGNQKEFESVLLDNIKDAKKLKLVQDTEEEYDVVMINSACKNLEKTMRKYYHRVKKNGLFCGSDHDDMKVKNALTTFRREDRIGTPISVSMGSWFWYKR